MNKISLKGIKWLFNKPIKVTNPIHKCLMCSEPAKSNMAKYCISCSDQRRIDNTRIQSIKKYNKLKKLGQFKKRIPEKWEYDR